MNEFIENRQDILDATMKKKENYINDIGNIEEQLRKQVEIYSQLIKNKEKAAQ